VLYLENRSPIYKYQSVGVVFWYIRKIGWAVDHHLMIGKMF